MSTVGLIEGFFGPAWSWEHRHHLCESLSKYGGDFYVYAPKKDPYLRKSWTTDHPPEMWRQLVRLSQKCREQKVSFGIGLSPFELHESWDQQAKQQLQEKIEKLAQLELTSFGLFFDDMRGSSDLAEKQCEIVEFTRLALERIAGLPSKALSFCPTYYTDDAILDKVFGPRPPFYLETIGKGIHPDVQIFWTGSKVISSTITAEELHVVSKVLQRKPLIWENYFANDGPKQCKFLKLKPFSGRSSEALKASSGWAINPMNQAYLSELVFLAALHVLKNGLPANEAYQRALHQTCHPQTAMLMERYQAELRTSLDLLDLDLRNQLQEAFGAATENNTVEVKSGVRGAKGSIAKDLQDWLQGVYNVDSECLTD